MFIFLKNRSLVYIHSENNRLALQVVELTKGSGVYIKKDKLAILKRITSATVLARHLLTYVFTPRASYNCTLSGKANQRSIDKEGKVRPGLSEEGVEVILGKLNVY